MTVKEIIDSINRGITFQATLDDGSFSIKIDRYVPYVCTAIHNGSNVRPELLKKMALDDYERWYEEDPHTSDFITSMPIVLVGNDSRFEYDLNRKDPIYEEAWGKKVWKKPLSQKEKALSLRKHANYYKVTHALIAKLESMFGAALVYDIHSFNYKRWGRKVPVFNLGTECIDNVKYSRFVDNWKKELEAISIHNIAVEAKENDVFYGRGYNLEYITSNFKNTLVLATEISKIYCNEETGEIFPQIIDDIETGLKKAILNNTSFFAQEFTNWKHQEKNKLLDNSITQNVQRIDSRLFRLLKDFELLTYVNPINVESERKKFFESKFTRNPEFKYQPIKIDPYNLKKQLHLLDTSKIKDVTIRHLYESVITASINKIDLLASLGTSDFFYNSLRYFGRPDSKDIQNANYILLLPDIKEETRKIQLFGIEEAKAHFNETFKKYGFHGKIKVDRSGVAPIMVLNSTKTVVLKEGSRFSKNELQYLAEHEIGVHMLTTMNAANNKLKVFSIGLPVNTRTGEGMAVLAEYLSGNFTMNRLRVLALRVIAVDMMCNGADFKTCFSSIVNRFNVEKNSAFKIVTRVYRGGGFTKDYLYLNGFSQLFRFWREGNDITPLLVGKTSLSFYNTIVEMIDRNIVEKPRYITESFRNPQIEGNNVLYDYILSGLR